MFMKSFVLFKSKWSSVNNVTVDNFIEYFENQWVKVNFNWFEGAYHGIPSHDNGLESTNRNIKDYHTFRQRLSLSQFLMCLTNLVKNWSRDRDSCITEDKMFHESPQIDTRLWTYSFQFAQSNKTIICKKGDDIFKSYYFCPDKTKIICAQFIQLHRKQEWNHFSNYVDWLNEVIKVEMHSTDWKLSKCSCSFFKKDYICSHMIGMGIRLGLCDAPLVAQNVEIGTHRGVGRPANVAPKSAWLESQDNYVSQFVSKSQLSISQASQESTAQPSSTIVNNNPCTSDSVATNNSEKVTKKRGRPPGSKNKKKKTTK
jgi:hypothetical protein